LYDSVIVVPLAVSATRVTDWAPGGKYHRKLLVAGRRLQDLGLVPTQIFWVQGASDKEAGMWDQEYIKRLHAIVDEFRRRGVVAPFFVSQDSLCGEGWWQEPYKTRDAASEPQPGVGREVVVVKQGNDIVRQEILRNKLRAAQLDVVDPRRNMYRGVDFDGWGMFFRPDGCHLATEAFDAIAQMMVDTVWHLAQKWAGPPPTDGKNLLLSADDINNHKIAVNVPPVFGTDRKDKHLEIEAIGIGEHIIILRWDGIKNGIYTFTVSIKGNPADYIRLQLLDDRSVNGLNIDYKPATAQNRVLIIGKAGLLDFSVQAEGAGWLRYVIVGRIDANKGAIVVQPGSDVSDGANRKIEVRRICITSGSRYCARGWP
jgi:hypothetical protein